MGAYVNDIEVRFADLDPRGHVNHATFATYLEQTRAGYVEDVLETDLVAIDMVLVHLEVDYERPIEIDDAVEVTLDVPSLGRTSVPMEYEVRADGERAAAAKTVQVITDPETGRARELPREVRERIVAFHGLSD